MKKTILGLALFLTTNFALATTMVVSSEADSGAGSLRIALEAGAKRIFISPSVGTIYLEEPLIYSGTHKVSIYGKNQTIDGSKLDEGEDILSFTGGPNIEIRNLKFVGNARGFNPNPTIPIRGKGIEVLVPFEKTGLVKVKLIDVMVTRTNFHGIHISDCTLGDECGSGSGGGGDGSPASISLRLDRVTINDSGFGGADSDGVRVDDRGEGNIYFLAKDSAFINNGADGVELDEGNDGDVVAKVVDSLFDSNGEYCILIPSFAGTPCDDDGDADVDDGFDIDEAGEGILYAKIIDTDVTNNFDEGLDFDTEDAGGAEVVVSGVFASDNEDEGLKISEEGSGSVNARLINFVSVDNNGNSDGVEIEEENDGNLVVDVNKSNMIGDSNEELKLEQMDAGTGTVKLKKSTVVLDLDGVTEL